MNKYFLKLIYILTLVSIISCGGVSFLSKDDTAHLYSKEFLSKISLIKTMYKKGNEKEALLNLKSMKIEGLLPAERGMRRNLLGVFYFSKNNFEQAILNFELALPKARLDKFLTAQIYINLASSYYKLGHLEKSLATINLCVTKDLSTSAEKKKYYRLRYNLAKELGQKTLAVNSLIEYLSDKKSINELKNDMLFEQLLASFFKLDYRNRLHVYETFEEKSYFNISYLAYLDMEKLYYQGHRDDAQKLKDWTEDRSSGFEEISKLLENFDSRVKNYAKMDARSIGVILPLSGDKQKFGKRALVGIDAGVRISNGKNSSVDTEMFRHHVRDSKGSGVVGALKVNELIKKHYVSVIIGGLFSAEATKEYLEARKHGVFFISLSEIYLPKEQKDHLLLEISGSVESQISRLFSDDMLNEFGRKAAIVFPKTVRGDAFVDEFWRKAKNKSVEVVGVHGFEKAATDHRSTIKNLLGLKFPRERQEERKLLSEIHALEKYSSIRRVQTLNPKIDFDWVFLPIFPREALQVIPAFTYYDAFNLKLIGGPSWRSRSLLKDSYKLGPLMFIGDDKSSASDNFKLSFEKLYGKRPKLIEMRSFDSYKIAVSLLAKTELNSRDDLDVHIRSNKSLEGITGTWDLKEGIWLKNMSALKIFRRKISKLEFGEEQ